MRRGSSSVERYAEHATPKSTPHPGFPSGGAASRVAATPKDTCQTPAFFVKVALQIVPPKGLLIDKRCQPSLGILTSPHLRFSLLSSSAWPGREKRSVPERFSKAGALAG